MKIRKITNKLLKQYPLKDQEEWDESGFLNRGNLDLEITKCFTCLDLNMRTIDEAIKQKVKLIVSHHPIFHKEKEKINSNSKAIIAKAKKNNITILSLHTCFDGSDVGMNWLIGTQLNLKNIAWYKSKPCISGKFKKALSVKQIADLFKKKFNVSLLTTNAKDTDKYQKVTICGGSGLSVYEQYFDEIKKEKILIITGDIKHHGWQDLNEYKIKALDVGHDLENCFSGFMANYIKQEFDVDCLAITTAKKEHSI